MYRTIAEKQQKLQELMPENREFKSWIEQSSLWNWIYTMFKINGMEVTRGKLVDMLSGKADEQVSLRAYSYAHACRKIFADMKLYVQMQSPLDVRMLERFAALFADLDPDYAPKDRLYRRDNPIIYGWGFIPEDHCFLAENMEIMFRWLDIDSNPSEPLENAARLFLEVNKLYPFGQGTADVAMAALVYNLTRLGLPVPELDLSAAEYNSIMSGYGATGDIGAFCAVLEKGLSARLDILTDMAGQIKSAEEAAVEPEASEQPKCNEDASETPEASEQ